MTSIVVSSGMVTVLSEMSLRCRSRDRLTIIDTIKPKRARFALEMMQCSRPDSVDNYLDLIGAIDRPAFVAHLDPV